MVTRHRHRRAGPCSSPAAPWSSRCSACSCMGVAFVNGLAVGASPPCCVVMAGVDHAAAGAARLRRPHHRPARACRRSTGRPRRRDAARLLVPLEPARPAPPVAARRSSASLILRRAGHPACCRCACAFTDAGNDPTADHHPPGLRPPGRGLRPRAPTARSCSPSSCPTARTTGRRSTRLADAAAATPAASPCVSPPPAQRRPATPPSSMVIPTTSPQDAATERRSSTTSATT